MTTSALSFTFFACLCVFHTQPSWGASYQLKQITPSQALTWTAFKFTSKTPVKGTFNTISHNITKPASSIVRLLSSARFTIKTASVSTGDAVRDTNISSSFFSKLDRKTTITGRVIEVRGDDTSGTIKLKLNLGRSADHTMTLKYVVTPSATAPGELTLTATGDLDLLSHHKLRAAFKALQMTCNALHTGPDGVSKTWSTVDIKVDLPLQLQ